MRTLLGGALVLLAALWGWGVGWRSRRVTRETRHSLRLALSRMREAIQWNQTPMPRLLTDLAASCSGEAKAFFALAAQAALEGEMLQQVWRSAAAALPLTQEERRAIQEVALTQGEEALERTLQGALAVLQRWEEAERQERRETEKRCATLWGCGGCMAVILLM